MAYRLQSRKKGLLVWRFPFVFIAGHNEHAAWTQTVAHTDIEDLYLIDLNEEGTHYFYGGKQYPLKLIEHNIYVKAG